MRKNYVLASALALTALFGTNIAYAQTTQTYTYTGTIQNWVVPAGVSTATITVNGAAGGSASTTTHGRGASLTAICPITPGHTINIVAGQQGTMLDVAQNVAANGGGGTFVYDANTNTPLIIAGGGGGVGYNDLVDGGNGGTDIVGTATDDVLSQNAAGGTGGGDGANGTGSSGGMSLSGNGGSGWSSNLASNFAGAANFGGGGAGGAAHNTNSGFAGGGGGGGGYNGGGGGNVYPGFQDAAGGGGGSYMISSGTLIGSVVDTNQTDGSVSIAYNLPPAAALNFDGVDDVVNFGYMVNSLFTSCYNTFTIEAWVKPTNLTGNGLIMGNPPTSSFSQTQFQLLRIGNYYNFTINTYPGQVSFHVTSQAGSAVAGAWQHVAGVWNGSNLMIYVNGVLQGTTTGVTASSFSYPVNNPLLIGNSIGSSPALPFGGSIDEVRIWGLARTQCQINTSMHCELSPFDRTSLWYYAKLNQGHAGNSNPYTNSIIDSAMYNIHGSLVNFALNDTTSNWVAQGAVTADVSCGPVVNPVVTVNSPSICAGSTATLTAGGNATSYTWSTTETATSVTVAPTQLTNYTVIGTDANYCVASATSTVSVNALPVITSQAINVHVCDGGTSTFTVGSTDASDTYQWYWFNGSVTGADNGTYGETNYNTSSMTINPITTTDWGPSGTQMVYCLVTNTANCTAKSLNDTIYINALPDNSTTLNGIVITASQSGATYQWVNCANNIAITGATTQSYTATVNGNYKVVVNNGTCSDTSACVSVTTVGVEQFTANANIIIYPNPNNGLFNLSISQFDNLKIHTIEIYNAIGDCVHRQIATSPNCQINLGVQANGIYFVKIVSDNSQIIKRIVINN